MMKLVKTPMEHAQCNEIQVKLHGFLWKHVKNMNNGYNTCCKWNLKNQKRKTPKYFSKQQH
jgi:hypothetical protein